MSFFSHQVAFGFKVSSPLEFVILNVANKMTGQILSDFHIAIGASAHATLVTEQFISCTRTALFDTSALFRFLT